MTHPRDCPICGGSQTIRLPVRQRISAVRPYPLPDIARDSSRTYPCPECAFVTRESRVALVEYHGRIDTRFEAEPGALDHAKRSTAHSIVAKLIEDGFFTFERGPADDRDVTIPIYVTLGVVSKATVASIEERIAQRQEEIAREVVAEAVENLVMGGRGGLAGIVRDALPVVMDRRKREKMEKPR